MLLSGNDLWHFYFVTSFLMSFALVHYSMRSNRALYINEKGRCDHTFEHGGQTSVDTKKMCGTMTYSIIFLGHTDRTRDLLQKRSCLWASGLIMQDWQRDIQSAFTAFLGEGEIVHMCVSKPLVSPQ
jgi:hypothetical protein